MVHFWPQTTPSVQFCYNGYGFIQKRVSFCTNLVASGTEAATLMKLARHRSLATTMKYYRGRTDDADRRAVERMFAVVTRAGHD